MKKILLTSLSFLATQFAYTQVQVGENIMGNNAYERLGNVTMSDSGNRIAVGSNDSSNGFTSNGKVQVYGLNAGTWSQIGSNITGIQNVSNIGQSIDFSGNGNFIATGSVETTINNFNGYARVFEIVGNTLTQVGQTLNGTGSENFGYQVDLSENGNILAVSSLSDNAIGQVKVYQNSAGTWTQMGQTINGLVGGDETGKKIELSDDGLTLMVSSPDTRDGSNNIIGLVRVFRFDGTSWNLLGQTFTGTYSFDIIKDASISENGNILVLGSSNNIRTLEYNGTSWVARGSVLSGFSPLYIKLVNNGNTMFLSNSTTTFANSNAVYRFNFVSNQWRMSGAPSTIPGSYYAAQFDASKNGEIMAIGNIGYNNVSQENGIVKVFDYTNTTQSCQTAATLTAYSGTINIGTITGTIPTGSGICYNYAQTNPNANWWSFTPTQNGLLDINTLTSQNANTTDTRISIYTGTCTALTCVTGNDNVSATDLRSSLNDIILTAGTTYYIVFDDKVSDNAAVNFFYEFTPQTCFRPGSINVGSVFTETAESVVWTAPTLGDTTPDSYTLQIGLSGYTVDSPAAIQTVTGVNALTYTFTGLTAATAYDIYIKTNCSATDSSIWYGPYRILTEFTAVNPTYTENFDTDPTSFLNLGWTRSGGNNSTTWRTYTFGPNTFTQNGVNAIYSITNPLVSTPTNVYAYSRKINLVAGQNYNVSYYTRQVLNSAVTTTGFLQVNYAPNADYTNNATHTQINALTSIDASAYFNQNHNFTVPTSGEYRIAFRNALQRSSTSSTTATAWLMLDNMVVSTALSVDEFNKSGMSLFPNPVLDFITINNPDNIQINTISVVDMNGRELLNNKYTTTSNTINLSNLSKGIYFIQLNTDKGILSKKIIKE
jgi:Secretion system C-terminal sorting domain